MYPCENSHACPRRDPHIRSAGRGGALGPRYSPGETIVLATRTRVGWGAGQPLRRGRVLGVGDPRWEGRSPHSSTPELTVGRAALGAVGETPVHSSVTLTCSDVQARGPAQDGGGGRGLPAGGALPESIAASSEAQVCVPAQPPRHLLLSLSRPRSRSVQTQIRFLSIPPAGLARPSPSALLLGAGRGASGSPPPRRPGSDRTLPLAPESRLARRPLHPPPGSLQTAP